MYRLSLFIFILLTSCGPAVIFEEPQPAGGDNLSEFPKSVQGQFLNMGSTLAITSNTIIKTRNFYFKATKNTLDGNYRLNGDSLIDIESNEKLKVTVIEDSISCHFHQIDTLFCISESHLLRKFKGFYFLNYQHEKKSWEVKMLSVDKHKLTISNATEREDKESVDDSSRTVLKPTRRQFRKFIRQDGFNETEHFVRQ